MSWLSGCRRLHRRYERKPEHFLAFVGITTALICHRRLVRTDEPNRHYEAAPTLVAQTRKGTISASAAVCSE